MRTLVLATLFVGALCCQDARAANRRAIVIGINTYNSGNISKPSSATVSRKALSQGDVRYWEYRDLNGPVADVALIEGLLKSADFGFTDADIVELLNGHATAQAILATLQ